MDRANEEVLRVLERDVLHPKVISTIVDKALDKFKASETEWKERRHSLHKQIKDIDIEIERLVAAVSVGGDIPVLVTAIKVANERRTGLSRDLAEVDSQQHSEADYDQLKKDLKAHFETSWQTVLSRQVGPTRQILRKLFNGNRLPFTPICDESKSRYEFEGTTSLSGLLDRPYKGLGVPNRNMSLSMPHLAHLVIPFSGEIRVPA